MQDQDLSRPNHPSDLPFAVIEESLLELVSGGLGARIDDNGRS